MSEHFCFILLGYLKNLLTMDTLLEIVATTSCGKVGSVF